MLLELLLAVPFPARAPLALPTGLLDGLENFLFTGTFASQQAEVIPSAGSTLVKLLHAVRTLDPEGRCLLYADAQEPLTLLGPQAPLPDAAELPEGWQEGLSEGTLTFHGSTTALEFALTARLLDRVRPGEPALRISLRAVARALWPETAAPSVQDTRFEAELLHFFRAEHAFDQLRAHLIREGMSCAEQLEQHLQPVASAPIERLARVLVLPDPAQAEGLLRGFSPDARRSLTAVGAAFQTLRPKTQEVFHLTPAGLEVWRGQHR